MAFAYDLAGNPIPGGRSIRELVWSVITDTTLPTWLTAPTGTVTITPATANNGRGACRITTGAVATNTASLQFINTLQDSAFQEIHWTFESLLFDNASANYDWRMAVDSAAGGAAFRQLAGDTTAFGEFSGAAPVTQYARSYSGRNAARKNLTLSLYPSDFAYEVQTDWSPFLGYERDPVNYGAGNLRPNFIMTTQEAVAHWFEFTTVRLRLVSS